MQVLLHQEVPEGWMLGIELEEGTSVGLDRGRVPRGLAAAPRKELLPLHDFGTRRQSMHAGRGGPRVGVRPARRRAPQTPSCRRRSLRPGFRCSPPSLIAGFLLCHASATESEAGLGRLSTTTGTAGASNIRHAGVYDRADRLYLDEGPARSPGMHALGFGSEYSVRGRVREHRGCEEGPPRIDRPGRLTGRKGVARPAWPGVSRIVRAPFQLWRNMLTAALHFLVASGQPTAHVTRPAFSMPAVSLPLMSHALLSACQRSAYRSRHTPCVQHANGQNLPPLLH